jgi:nucleotide-binding universal stress UspA family protein
MKILVAVDGSECSLAAVDALIARIDWFREPPVLELAFVHPPLPYPKAASWVGKETVQKYYEEEADAALRPAEERLKARGIAYARRTLVGDAAQELARHASASGCDLIAMGTHGHTALSNLVLGSTATKVLACSKVPVLFSR